MRMHHLLLSSRRPRRRLLLPALLPFLLAACQAPSGPRPLGPDVSSVGRGVRPGDLGGRRPKSGESGARCRTEQ